MTQLLTVTAVIEAGTGLLLVALPSPLATLLLGSSLDSPVALTVARVAGVALLALALACWLARHDGRSAAGRGVVGAMALYNAATVVLFVHAGTALGLSATGLWPTALAHATMTVWCVASLLTKQHS